MNLLKTFFKKSAEGGVPAFTFAKDKLLIVISADKSHQQGLELKSLLRSSKSALVQLKRHS